MPYAFSAAAASAASAARPPRATSRRRQAAAGGGVRSGSVDPHNEREAPPRGRLQTGPRSRTPWRGINIIITDKPVSVWG